MVSFRVSPEEYRSLCQACSAQGVRSVSELARAAVQMLIKAKTVSEAFDDQLQDLRTRVQFLSAELERLSRHVERDAMDQPNV
jgi:Arc/MetJ-type ribon-helix-helix transcriptional regulator